MHSLTPAESTDSSDRRWSPTSISCFSDPFHGPSSQNLSIETGLENHGGAALYEYNSSLENSSITTNPHTLNANDLSRNSSLTPFPQGVALTELSSTAEYQRTSPPITTYGTDSISFRTSRDFSSTFTFDDILSNNINNNTNSDPSTLTPFPRQHSFNMLTKNQPSTNQIFLDIDTSVYPPPCVSVHHERMTREQRTEPWPSSPSSKRQRGPPGARGSITHPFSPQNQSGDTSPIIPIETPRYMKRRVIQREAHTQQHKSVSSV